MPVVQPGVFGETLARLDARLAREIGRLRARYHLSLDEFRGLYVSDEQVDSLLSADHLEGGELSGGETLLAGDLEVDARWRRLVEVFGLSALDQELIVIALAPELDLKYEAVYAYLNDDVTRKWPTGDLARRLLAPSAARAEVLQALGPASAIRSRHLTEIIEPPTGRPSLLNTGFAIHPSLSRYLQGVPLAPDAALTLSAADQFGGDLPFSVTLVDEIERLGRLFDGRIDFPLIVFEGLDAAAQLCAARLLARSANRPLRMVDLSMLRRSSSPAAVATLGLEAQLERHMVCIGGLESVLDADGRVVSEARSMLADLSAIPLIVSARSGLTWSTLVGDRRVRVISLEVPEYAGRLQLWTAALDRAELPVPEVDRRSLADRYVFTATEIVHAVEAARESRQFQGNGGSDADCLRAEARAVARQRAGQRDGHSRASFGWADLVLPPHTLSRLKELAAAIRLRHVVFGEWAFGKRAGAGTGVKALFAGASGTGKTMAAGVMARELSLDLVKIDLAATVSKYIGETEKNLDRIFSAAHAGGSLLFFDEADAIFGKRSEVKEAHDRYANIEVAYLLQKLEDHDGAVILATNLRRNIDDAFSRRLQYVVDFPQPDVVLRERLWRGMFPPEAPVDDEVDFPFLAKQFELAGGDIRNVVLDAAFLAASENVRIGMSQVVRALAHQVTKQGKTTSPSAFQRYHALLEDTSLGGARA